MSNVNLDRFRPPEPSDESRVSCASCGNERYADEMMYDEHMNHYLCDRQCFDDWHDENSEVVGDFYFDLNVY